VTAATVRVPATVPAPRQPLDRAEGWRLLAAAAGGDMDAYAQLWERYYPAVWRYVSSRTHGQVHLAEDLVADVFARALAALRKRPPRDIGQDVGAWFMTIAKHRVADHYNSVPVHCSAGPVGVGFDRADAAWEARPAEVAAVGEARRVLAAALTRLTVAQQQVIAARYVAGLSVTETATRLGMTEVAVKSATMRACHRLAYLIDGVWKGALSW